MRFSCGNAFLWLLGGSAALPRQALGIFVRCTVCDPPVVILLASARLSSISRARVKKPATSLAPRSTDPGHDLRHRTALLTAAAVAPPAASLVSWIPSSPMPCAGSRGPAPSHAAPRRLRCASGSFLVLADAAARSHRTVPPSCRSALSLHWWEFPCSRSCFGDRWRDHRGQPAHASLPGCRHRPSTTSVAPSPRVNCWPWSSQWQRQDDAAPRAARAPSTGTWVGATPGKRYQAVERSGTGAGARRGGPAGRDDPPLTVEETVTLGRYARLGAWSSIRREDRIAIDRALERCDVAALARRRTDTLSGGEWRRSG